MSFEDLLKLADDGDVNAQYEIGYLYDRFGNSTQAIKYYQLSANQNHPKALNCVGWCYSNGCGVTQNYNKAFEYYLLSAEQKYQMGCANVAYFYKLGRGVKQDLKKALEYYRLGGEQGDANDCERLILKQFSKTLNKSDYVYAYPLYVKHNYKGLDKLKTLLNAKYIKAMYFMPSVLSGIIISFLL